MDDKLRMISQVWNKKKDYYAKTDTGNVSLVDGPHYRLIFPTIKKSKTILEVGCGNGGVLKELAKVTSSKTVFYGVDISALAIRLAKKNFPQGHFQVSDGEKLPYTNGQFDCTCSFFTFEHLSNPQIVFDEMIRVTKKGGAIMIICPNYGSPIYPSPCTTYSIPKRVFRWLVKSIKMQELPHFGWDIVHPIANTKPFHVPDEDTTVEPNLDMFLSSIQKQYQHLRVLHATSLWETVKFSASIPFFIGSLPFRLVGQIIHRPFLYWGPLFVVILKKDRTQKTTKQA